MDKAKRKLKNYLIHPSFQIKVAGYFVLALFAAYGLMILLFYNQFDAIRTTIAESSTTYLKLAEPLNEIFLTTIWLLTLSYLIFGLVTVFFAIVISHRVAGPMVAIHSLISDLKDGNYASRRTLRPYDDMKQIVDGLNELGESLEKRHKT